MFTQEQVTRLQSLSDNKSLLLFLVYQVLGDQPDNGDKRVLPLLNSIRELLNDEGKFHLT